MMFYKEIDTIKQGDEKSLQLFKFEPLDFEKLIPIRVISDLKFYEKLQFGLNK